MTDLATRLVDAVNTAMHFDEDGLTRWTIDGAAASATAAAVLKEFAAHIGPPWPSHEADGLHTAWTEALKIINDLEQQ